MDPSRIRRVAPQLLRTVSDKLRQAGIEALRGQIRRTKRGAVVAVVAVKRGAEEARLTLPPAMFGIPIVVKGVTR